MLALAAEAVKGLPVVLVQRSYSAAKDVLKELGIDRVHGVLLDLGFSSDQLAWTDRGFSFAREGPLDMRFDPEGELSAADIVNDWDEQEIADVIYQFGEERNSRRIAQDRRGTEKRADRNDRPLGRDRSKKQSRQVGSDRPVNPDVSSASDRGESGIGTSRFDLTRTPRPADERRQSGDHQLSFLGRSSSEMGVSKRAEVDRDLEKTDHGLP